MYWYKNPYKWLDSEDITASTKSDYGSVYDLLRDLLVERPTETEAFVHLFLRALNNLDHTELTYRQTQAVLARAEAISLGRRDVLNYVSNKLQITLSSASELLQRADQRLQANIRKSDKSFSYLNISKNIDTTSQRDKKLIDKWMSAHKRQCAGYGRMSLKKGNQLIPACKGETVRNNDLCWDCRQVYGVYGEWPDWLRTRALDLRREHRQDAIEALMRAGQLETDVVLHGEYESNQDIG